MSKRGASRELNHDNWDEEEETEEAGTFRKAPTDVVNTRVIKQAKRRLNTGTEENSPAVSRPFSSFSGLSSTSTTPKPFSFTTQSSNSITGGVTSTNSFVLPQKPTAATFTPTTTKTNTFNTAASSVTSLPSSSSSSQTSTASSSPVRKRNNEFYDNLQQLNRSLAECINKHISKEPCCVLTPLFKDYESHYKSLQEKYPIIKPNGVSPAEEKPKSVVSPVTSLSTNNTTSVSLTSAGFFSSSNSTVTTSNGKEPEVVPFKFGQATTSIFDNGFSSKPSDKPFTFSGMPKSGGFFSSGGFSAAGSSSLGGLGGSTSSTSGGNTQQVEGDDEPYEPPTADVTPVTEENSLLSKRCKVFIKKDADFKSHGIGNIHVKSTDSGKVQLIVRADTTLGNIIINTLITKQHKIIEKGDKDMMIACFPTPEDKSPVPVLFRVKGKEDLQELVSTINDNIKE